MEAGKYDMRLILAIINGQVSAALNRKMKRNFVQYNVNITPEQWVVLHQLWGKDGSTQNELCHATQKDKTSMTRLIDHMEKQHLVVRIPDMTDHRHRHVYLTQHAKEIKEKATFVAIKTLREVLRGLSTEEVKVSQELLRIVYKNCCE